MSLQEAKQFVAHFITGEYAPEEYATFLRWLKGATAEELNAIADEHESLHEHWSLSPAAPSPEWVAQLERKLDKIEEPVYLAPVRRIGFGRIYGKKTLFAAASIVILISAGTWWFESHSGVKPYSQHGTDALTNSSFIPKGGALKTIMLADGSKVLLNAASTLKYPSAFSGKERVVQLSGEAFFEVTRNSDMPFRVLIKDAEVEVLGTDFNVMAYEEEPASRTTLVDGAVKVITGSQNATLKPGEQAEIQYASTGVPSKITITGDINEDVVLAWKKGFLQFKNEDLHVVMREIGRSYNVEIQYEPNIPTKRITGSFSREAGLSENLKELENLLSIHFTNDGKTVKVKL